MISRHPFLSVEEALEFKARIFSHKNGQGLKSGLNHVIGVPIGSEPEREKRITSHNLLMKTHFDDLLKKLQSFFEDHFGGKVFFAEEISLPGFHIFGVLPHKQRPTWFHQDNEIPRLMKMYPEFGVTEESQQYTFTILLEAPEGMVSGLLYFEDHSLGLKVERYNQYQHHRVQDFATLFPYTPGEINIYDRVIHSVFAQNDTDQALDRVTVQGHVVKTPMGFLIFW